MIACSRCASATFSANVARNVLLGVTKMMLEISVASCCLQTPPPRFKSMPIDQDWTTVWPSAHTFKWSAVPFPVRQGYVEVRVVFFLTFYLLYSKLHYFTSTALCDCLTDLLFLGCFTFDWSPKVNFCELL